MLVSIHDYEKVIEEIAQENFLGFDVETTGLMIWHEDRIFSFSIANSWSTYYFNFNDRLDHEGKKAPEEFILDKGKVLSLLSKHVFSNPDTTISAHTAKFELASLLKEGVEVKCHLYDTEVGARIEKNNELSYELSEVALRAEMRKNEAVEEYITKNKVYEWQTFDGKKARRKNKQYWRVPFEIMQVYAQQDARLAYDLAMGQIKTITEIDLYEADRFKGPTLMSVLADERKITKVVFDMERTGILIDEEYCKKAIEHEDRKMATVEKEFKDFTGFEFKDSNVHLLKVFSGFNIRAPKTDKGNPSFTDTVLSGFIDSKSENGAKISKMVLDWRDSQKRANTYFRSFLFHAKDRVIHTNLRQAGTVTGRFSCREPNLQNLSKEEDEGLLYPVRRAFIPRPGCCFVMIDYCQMEFRMMLDQAEQMDLIEKIKNGFDPHDATSELTGLPRKTAKILNFGLLYGMGTTKLAKALGVSIDDARLFKARYFLRLPQVKAWIKAVMSAAENRQFVRSWAGRYYHFQEKAYSYKAPNAVIQGGCADVVKKAMLGIQDILRGTNTKLLMQIHDELLFEVPLNELDVVPKLQRVMETVYPYRSLPLTCSIEHSLKSWGEPEEGLPGEKTRDEIQGEGDIGFTKNTEPMVCENSASCN